MSSNKNKPPSCNKVKNPCKFCLQQVDKKTGLQCQGACKKWAHFKCLNYTPGKISDIKAGIIKVTCPCPDCETTEPKEFLTNPPFTCSNNQCPANKTPKCESFTCPSNKRRQQNPVPDYPSNSSSRDKNACANEPIPCPAAECPNAHQQKRSHPRMSPPRPPTPPRSTPKNKSPTGSPKCRTPQTCRKNGGKSKPSPKLPPCPNQCDTSQKKKKSQCPAAKSPSCSILSSENSAYSNKECISSSSESHVRAPGNKASLVQALQEMCGTVGKLSVQLKELMCKMMQNV